MTMLDIHPQLLEDCHYLGRMPAAEVLLHRNASLPWFILVPETDLPDFLDLPREHREAVLADCAHVARFLKQVLGMPKVNFAGLGNVVPQLHLHIIGRAPMDPCWPQPVWGTLEGSEDYTQTLVEEWQQALAKMGELKPAKLQSF